MCFYFFSDGVWLKDLSTDELYAPWVKQLDAFEGRHYDIVFSHPKLNVLTNDPEQPIAKMEWGLMPSGSKDKSFQKNTLDARLETLEKKPSFRSYLKNRCLIPAESFVEWRWLNPKGKAKHLKESD